MQLGPNGTMSALTVPAIHEDLPAMSSNRSYRALLTQAQIRAEIERNSGTQFDPTIARIMLSIIDEDKDYQLHE